MLCMSGILLVYTAVIVPVQLCLWSYDDPCNYFPTLFFDVFVDSFFLVSNTQTHARASQFPDPFLDVLVAPPSRCVRAHLLARVRVCSCVLACA
jgi:hypothetical protein